jgi:hydroxymethylglutaryl-CoA lyase
VLVPNLRGAEAAVRAGAHKLTLPFSASETHSRKNVRRTHSQMLEEARNISNLLREQPAHSRPVLEGGISTALAALMKESFRPTR